MDNENKTMKIIKIRKCGKGVEILINNNWYFFNTDVTLSEIKASVEEIEEFNAAEYNNLKKLEGTNL